MIWFDNAYVSVSWAWHPVYSDGTSLVAVMVVWT